LNAGGRLYYKRPPFYFWRLYVTLVPCVCENGTKSVINCGCANIDCDHFASDVRCDDCGGTSWVFKTAEELENEILADFYADDIGRS
jgi:hypothetical protein